MFTGIIQTKGIIADITTHPGGDSSDIRMHICGGIDVQTLKRGDSIAVSGVCLTATAFSEQGFWVDVSAETLSRTIFATAKPGMPVNLEPALTLQSTLDGHMVSGHVDGLGTIEQRREDARSVRFEISAPDALSRYIAVKGSICVDGISLTVNDIDADRFGVNIVPHTLNATTMESFTPGQKVNLEIDIIARYLERLLAHKG